MRRVHVIGGKNHGKTTLVCELVAEFRRRGLRVGTIKHTHHHHELDTPGKDSHRHREAGAEPIGILSPGMNAVFWPRPESADLSESGQGEERYAGLLAIFEHCDVLLIEGDTRTWAPKIEVWRAARGTSPLAEQLSNVLALISDDAANSSVPVIPRSDLGAIADFILTAVPDCADRGAGAEHPP